MDHAGRVGAVAPDQVTVGLAGVDPAATVEPDFQTAAAALLAGEGGELEQPQVPLELDRLVVEQVGQNRPITGWASSAVSELACERSTAPVIPPADPLDVN